MLTLATQGILCNVKYLHCVAKYQNPLRMIHLILHVQTRGEVTASPGALSMDVDPSGWWQGTGCAEKAAQGPAVILTVSPSRLAPDLTSLVVSPCPQVPAGIVSLLSFCKQPGGQARLSQALIFISVATKQLSTPCPDQLFSPQTCDHDSEFIFWMFSQMNMPVTFPWGLKNTFQCIFPYHHTAPEMSLRNIYGEVTHS